MNFNNFTIDKIKSITAYDLYTYQEKFNINTDGFIGTQTLEKLKNNINKNDSNLTKIKRTNCPNCGAPITSYKCEYCGTRF